MYSHSFLHLILAVVLLSQLPCGTSFIDQICVNLGHENLREYSHSTLYFLSNGKYIPLGNKHIFCGVEFNSSPFGTFIERNSSASIGGKKFCSSSIGSATLAFEKEALGIVLEDQLLRSCCDLYNHTDRADIQMFGVKHNGKYLNGWLGFEVYIKEEIFWAFVQVSDEWGNAIGEFVQAPQPNCGNADPSLNGSVVPKTEQFLPCSATGLQEAKPSQSVVWVSNKITDRNDTETFMASPNNLTLGLRMRFTWKLNEYYCSRHAKFRIVLYYLTKAKIIWPDQEANFHRGPWLIPKWFGVADLIPQDPSTKLDCSTPVNLQMIQGATNFWITDWQPMSPENDNLQASNAELEGPGFPPTLYKACRTYITRLHEYVYPVILQPSYGGRCEKMDEKKFKPAFYIDQPHSTSSVDVPHQCLKNPGASYPTKLVNLKDYKDKKTKYRKSICNEKAAKCPNLQGLTIDKLLQIVRPVPPHFTRGRYILKSRAYHGLMFVLVALFILPISNFLARFFKETFLNKDVFGLPVWYFLHLASTVLILNMSVSGLIANWKVSRVWGRSWTWTAFFHRIIGWIWVGLFAIVLILGPIRPLKSKSRVVVMVLHASLGYLLYFFGLIAVVSSALVPGSPSATTCYRKVSVKLQKKTIVSVKAGDVFQHHITTAVIWWFSFDLFFYVLMNFLQRKADQAWQVQRTHHFPLIPVVRMDDTKSFKCHRYRVLVLILYVFILGIIVVVTCQRLYASDWKTCDNGPMTCTHANLSAGSGYPEVQCGRLASIRALQKKKPFKSETQLNLTNLNATLNANQSNSV